MIDSQTPWCLSDGLECIWLCSPTKSEDYIWRLNGTLASQERPLPCRFHFGATAVGTCFHGWQFSFAFKHPDAFLHHPRSGCSSEAQPALSLVLLHSVALPSHGRAPSQQLLEISQYNGAVFPSNFPVLSCMPKMLVREQIIAFEVYICKNKTEPNKQNS